ncbi:unnamed protein product [Moneuplotes crassus]|uniref:Uncharacterized protein n=1 Tax=Euplotes crassus TaxID=5936 RepID=A0AAD1UA46_EUPCR|nr:unnamed protein product [Moneuplotes crassus]
MYFVEFEDTAVKVTHASINKDFSPSSLSSCSDVSLTEPLGTGSLAFSQALSS